MALSEALTLEHPNNRGIALGLMTKNVIRATVASDEIMNSGETVKRLPNSFDKKPLNKVNLKDKFKRCFSLVL